MLFSESEKQTIWDRLVHGRVVSPEPMLAHTMLVADANLKRCKQIDNRLYIQTRAAYRLVRRHCVSTTTQFNHVAKELLK